MKADAQPASSAFRIVVIEDNPALAAAIVKTLERAELEAHAAADAESGLRLARTLPADLVVLDVSLPGIDGLEACRRLRRFSDAYVIMLTGHGSERDRLLGLAAGADDYMTKPFYPRELVARIGAMRRRPRGGREEVRKFGDLTIEAATQRVKVGTSAIELSQIEYRLLNVLSVEPDRILTRAEILREVWGEGWVGDDHLVDVHISNLRGKLGDDPGNPTYIRTLRGRGFSMSGAR